MQFHLCSCYHVKIAWNILFRMVPQAALKRQINLVFCEFFERLPQTSEVHERAISIVDFR
jgi:hypothetical protein